MNARRRVVLASAFAAALLALAVPIVFGALWPPYSHVRHYISVLGARDAPHAAWVNYLGFLPIGLATITFTIAAGPFFPESPRARRGRALLAAFGAGYAATAFLPCDPGCPALGSVAQCLHSLFAVCGYTGAVAGLMLLASSFALHSNWRSMAMFTRVCGLMLALGFVLMLLPPLAPWRGLTQRVAEAAVFVWVAASAVRIALHSRQLGGTGGSDLLGMPQRR